MVLIYRVIYILYDIFYKIEYILRIQYYVSELLKYWHQWLKVKDDDWKWFLCIV